MQVTICYLKMIRETNSMAVKNGLYHVPRELDISRKTKRKAWELKALIVFNNLPEKNNCWITKDRRAYVQLLDILPQKWLAMAVCGDKFSAVRAEQQRQIQCKVV